MIPTHAAILTDLTRARISFVVPATGGPRTCGYVYDLAENNLARRAVIGEARELPSTDGHRHVELLTADHRVVVDMVPFNVMTETLATGGACEAYVLTVYPVAYCFKRSPVEDEDTLAADEFFRSLEAGS